MQPEKDAPNQTSAKITASFVEQIKTGGVIKEPQEYLQRLFMLSPYAFSIMKGKDMIVTVANKLMKDFWGKGLNIEGKTLLEILPEYINQPFPSMIDSVYTTGNPVYANEILAKLNYNGKMVDRYFNIVYQPYREIADTISGVITIAHEVTNQVLERRKLEVSEAFNRSILQSSPDCIKILDNDGRIQFINDNGLCLMEIDDFSFLKNSYWWNLWEERSQHLIKDALKKAMSGEKVQFQAFANTQKGTPKWWDVIVLPVQLGGETGKEQQILSVSRDITELKEATLKLEESENRYSNMIYTSPALIAILKGEQMIIEIANDEIIKSWGKDKSIIGKSIFNELPETVEQGFDKLLLSVYNTGKPIRVYEAPFTLLRNGKPEIVYYTFVYQAQKDASGKIIGVAVIANEVSPQAVSNYKIRASEQQFRLLVQQAPVAICVLRGKNYVIEVVNHRMLEMWDRTLNQVINIPAFEVLTELKEQGFKELLDNVYNSGETFVDDELPITLRRKGKLQNLFVKFIYEPLREADGTISGVMALAHEITEQVNTRKKLQLQEEMVKDLLLNAPAFICTLTGPLHVYDLINQRYQSIFGKRQILGKPIMEVLPELDRQGFDIILDKVYQSGEPFVGIEIPIFLARGENSDHQLYYFNFSCQPMFDEYKKVYSILVFGYEVTDQVNSKNKNTATLKQREKELETKVQQRTHELNDSNESLKQINEELKKSNKELESFSYITGHDLQEPLRKIQTLIGRLVEKENHSLSTKGKDYFNRIQGEATRMRTLIHDLLEFSRISTADLKFESTDLTSIVKEVMEEYQETIKKKKAIIEIKEICNFKTIRFQFRQLMHNLISNALKFSNPAIQPHIIINSQIIKYNKPNQDNIPLHQEYCHISISDNGIGFEKKYSQKIFEVFQRLHGKEVYPGTGIGLAIVKKIVDNHNGIITATSALKRGATFNIYIPVDGLKNVCN